MSSRDTVSTLRQRVVWTVVAGVGYCIVVALVAEWVRRTGGLVAEFPRRPRGRWWMRYQNEVLASVAYWALVSIVWRARFEVEERLLPFLPSLRSRAAENPTVARPTVSDDEIVATVLTAMDDELDRFPIALFTVPQWPRLVCEELAEPQARVIAIRVCDALLAHDGTRLVWMQGHQDLPPPDGPRVLDRPAPGGVTARMLAEPTDLHGSVPYLALDRVRPAG